MARGSSRRRRAQTPMRRLVLEMRTASAQIMIPAARALAAREAATIPETRAEIAKTIKGRIIVHARALMRDLPGIEDPQVLAEMARVLEEMAQAVSSPVLEEAA